MTTDLTRWIMYQLNGIIFHDEHSTSPVSGYCNKNQYLFPLWVCVCVCKKSQGVLAVHTQSFLRHIECLHEALGLQENIAFGIDLNAISTKACMEQIYSHFQGSFSNPFFSNSGSCHTT